MVSKITRLNRMWEELHAGEELGLDSIPVDAIDLRYTLEMVAMLQAFIDNDDENAPPARMVADSISSLEEEVE